MVLTPSYFIADIQSGFLHGTKLPLHKVTLNSSRHPGSFSASLDLRQYGRYDGRTEADEMADGRALVDMLKHGRYTLVPVIEGIPDGTGNPITSRALGEWWISEVEGSHQSPVITLSGPEFAGYVKEVIVTEDWRGDLDPVAGARAMLARALRASQDIVVDVGMWESDTGAIVSVDVQEASQDYWSAISDLQDNPAGPFEWAIRVGLDWITNSWSPIRVTRRLVVGQPKLATENLGVTLNLKAPGKAPGIVLDRDWSFSEARSATDMYGLGAGSGTDQIGPVHEVRSRAAGEPEKSRVITVPTAMNTAQLRRQVLKSLRQMTPKEQVFRAPLRADMHIPGVGEVYTWRQEESWTLPSVRGVASVEGWTWRSVDPSVFELSMTEV